MSSKPQKKSLTNLVVFIVIILALGVTVWYIVSSSSTVESSSQAISVKATKYASSLKKLEKFIITLDTSLFNYPIFSQLTSFMTTPLETGRLGKNNPFETPPAPEELLLNSQEQ